jgi:hypothetical protein
VNTLGGVPVLHALMPKPERPITASYLKAQEKRDRKLEKGEGEPPLPRIKTPEAKQDAPKAPKKEKREALPSGSSLEEQENDADWGKLEKEVRSETCKRLMFA